MSTTWLSATSRTSTADMQAGHQRAEPTPRERQAGHPICVFILQGTPVRCLLRCRDERRRAGAARCSRTSRLTSRRPGASVRRPRRPGAVRRAGARPRADHVARHVRHRGGHARRGPPAPQHPAPRRAAAVRPRHVLHEVQRRRPRVCGRLQWLHTNPKREPLAEERHRRSSRRRRPRRRAPTRHPSVVQTVEVQAALHEALYAGLRSAFTCSLCAPRGPFYILTASTNHFHGGVRDGHQARL